MRRLYPLRARNQGARYTICFKKESIRPLGSHHILTHDCTPPCKDSSFLRMMYYTALYDMIYCIYIDGAQLAPHLMHDDGVMNIILMLYYCIVCLFVCIHGEMDAWRYGCMGDYT